MPSWSIAEACLVVAGSGLLLAGTGAQAWASLTEYRDIFADLPEAAKAAIEVSKPSRLAVIQTRRFIVVTPAARAVLAEIPRQVARLREEHGEAAARAATLLRLATVWTVLSAGAVLLLAAAIIQLVLSLT